MRKLLHILPFMESAELKELALKIINDEVKGVKLRMVFPFLSREDLNEIIDLLIEKKKTRQLNFAVPFMSKAKINQIYQGIIKGEIEGIHERVLYPFLGREELKKMFDHLVKHAEENPDDEDDETMIYHTMDDDEDDDEDDEK